MSTVQDTFNVPNGSHYLFTPAQGVRSSARPSAHEFLFAGRENFPSSSVAAVRPPNSGINLASDTTGARAGSNQRQHNMFPGSVIHQLHPSHYNSLQEPHRDGTNWFTNFFTNQCSFYSKTLRSKAYGSSPVLCPFASQPYIFSKSSIFRVRSMLSHCALGESPKNLT